MAFDYKKELFRYRHYYQRFEPALQKPETAAYTMVVLSIMTMSFFGLFAIRPTITTIASLNREIEDDRYVNEQFDKKISALIAAQENHQSIQKDLSLIYKSVPTSSEFSTLLLQIEALAQEYNASLSAIQFQSVPFTTPVDATISATTYAQSPQSFEFTISLEADYSQIVQFIERLMDINRLTIIKQLDINGSENNTLLEISLLLSSFYLP